MTFTFRGMTLPDHLIESLRAFADTGRPCGSFLQACIDNDLRLACMKADDDNIHLIPVIVAYLHNEMPMRCWGFAEAHANWVMYRAGQRREKAQADRERCEEIGGQQ